MFSWEEKNLLEINWSFYPSCPQYVSDRLHLQQHNVFKSFLRECANTNCYGIQCLLKLDCHFLDTTIWGLTTLKSAENTRLSTTSESDYQVYGVYVLRLHDSWTGAEGGYGLRIRGTALTVDCSMSYVLDMLPCLCFCCEEKFYNKNSFTSGISNGIAWNSCGCHMVPYTPSIWLCYLVKEWTALIDLLWVSKMWISLSVMIVGCSSNYVRKTVSEPHMGIESAPSDDQEDTP